jgi:spermidine synthase
METKIDWANRDFGQVYRGRLLLRTRSRYQLIEILQNPTFGKMLFLDGVIQTSERVEDRYHQNLVTAPLLAHPAPSSLGIIGGGDGFALEEAVKISSLKRILLVELDPLVLQICRRHFPLVQACLKDPRVTVVHADARAYLEKNDEPFDVLVVDLTEPQGLSRHLYTREFYRLCARRLHPEGILSVHGGNDFFYPEAFASIRKTLATVFPHIATARLDMPSYGMSWTFRLASRRPLPLQRMARRHAKLMRQRPDLNDLRPDYFRTRPGRTEQQILRRHGRISTDKNPFEMRQEPRWG